MERIAVFIDYENVHRTAHGLYSRVGDNLFSTVVDPIKIAERVVSKRQRGGNLTSIRVFRGRPVPEFQRLPASANDIHADAWQADPRLILTRRDLKYDKNDDGTFTAREKGIDVALAIDLTAGALNREFDVAIVFTCDTDILPALELVFQQRLSHLEIACWSRSRPLWFPHLLREDPPKRLPYCHFLDEHDFVDCRDYSADNLSQEHTLLHP